LSNLNSSIISFLSYINYYAQRYEYEQSSETFYSRMEKLRKTPKFIKVLFLPSEKSAVGDGSNSISSLLHRTRISGIYESAIVFCIAHGKCGNISDHFPSPLFVVKPELARETSWAKNIGAVSPLPRSPHDCRHGPQKPYPSFFLLTDDRCNIFQNTSR